MLRDAGCNVRCLSKSQDGSHDNSISFVSQRAFCLLGFLELFVWHTGDVADQAKSLLPFGVTLTAASMSAVCWNHLLSHCLQYWQGIYILYTGTLAPP